MKPFHIKHKKNRKVYEVLLHNPFHGLLLLSDVLTNNFQWVEEVELQIKYIKVKNYHLKARG